MNEKLLDARNNSVELRLGAEDITFAGGFGNCLAKYNLQTLRVVFDKEFIRAFYSKPNNRIDAELRAISLCEAKQLREIGSWFDVLLKWYILLSVNLDYSKEEFQQFVEKYHESTYHVRWKLDSPIYEGTEEFLKFPSVYARHSAHERIDDFIEYHESANPANLTLRNGIIYNTKLGMGWKANSHVVTPEMVNDLSNLIRIIDCQDFAYNETFAYRIHLLGVTLDFLLDDLLLDVKTTSSATLSLAYYDQLVSYFMRFLLLKNHFFVSDLFIQSIGVYFARYGYLYKVPVEQVIDIQKVESFIYG